MKTLFTLFLFIIILITSIQCWSQSYSGGSGTISNPFQISNKSDLKYLSENTNQWGYHYVQIADIQFTYLDFASGGDFNNGGSGFIPIGNSQTKFSGSYNGKGYIIDSLFINRPFEDYIGLFGEVYPATIDSLGVTNADISGEDYVGILAGSNVSNINNCFVTGRVTGNFSIGGLVGENAYGFISDCYATSNVYGIFRIGGLVGLNDVSSINNCYATGNVVLQNSSGGLVGGLVGMNFDATISNCFWNLDTNQTGIGGTTVATPTAIGKTTIEMKNQSTFTNATWDFVGETTNGSNDYWELANCVTNNGYPILSWQKQNIPTLSNDSLNTLSSTVSCNGKNDGGIDLTVNASFAPFTFTWNNNSITEDLSNLSAGEYSVIVTDVNGCIAYDTINITEPLVLNSVITSKTNVSCNGESNGSIDISVSGGTASYNFLWSNSETTEDITGLSTGEYSVIVTDANGCIAYDTVIITEPSPIDVSTINSDVTITATAVGMQYQWIDCDNNNSPIQGETNQSFTATQNGRYAVIVINGICSDTSDCVIIYKVGLSEILNTKLADVYPNPTSGEMWVDLPTSEETTITLYNSLGKKLKTIISKSKHIQLQINETPGIYYLELNNKQFTQTIRVVKY